MALVNGFDPSKEYVVIKGFFEGGWHYREGDEYRPLTKIGKSKALFRHFVAKRIKQKEDVKGEPKKPDPVETTTPTEGVKKEEEVVEKPKKKAKKKSSKKKDEPESVQES